MPESPPHFRARGHGRFTNGARAVIGRTNSTLHSLCVLKNCIEDSGHSRMQPLPILFRDTIDVAAVAAF